MKSLSSERPLRAVVGILWGLALSLAVWALVVFGALQAFADTDPGYCVAPNCSHPPGDPYLRGDVNYDSVIDISDVVELATRLNSGQTFPNQCTAPWDLNNDGYVTNADLTHLTTYLFSGGPGPAEPCAVCCPDHYGDLE